LKTWFWMLCQNRSFENSIPNRANNKKEKKKTEVISYDALVKRKGQTSCLNHRGSGWNIAFWIYMKFSMILFQMINSAGMRILCHQALWWSNGMNTVYALLSCNVMFFSSLKFPPFTFKFKFNICCFLILRLSWFGLELFGWNFY
jgi:hypothetical protein